MLKEATVHHTVTQLYCCVLVVHEYYVNYLVTNNRSSVCSLYSYGGNELQKTLRLSGFLPPQTTSVFSQQNVVLHVISPFQLLNNSNFVWVKMQLHLQT